MTSKAIRRKLPSRPPPTPTSEELESNTLSFSTESSLANSKTSEDFDNETEMVPRTIYNELLLKYEKTCLELTQQKTYVTALEKMIDFERNKVQEIQKKEKPRSHQRRHSSKASLNYMFNLKTKEKDKETQQDQIQEEKEKEKRKIAEKESNRRCEAESRLAHCLSDKKKMYRMNVLQEIYSTECDYVETLHTLVLCQSKLLKSGVIFDEEVYHIFSNIEEIHTLHKSTADEIAGCFECAGDENCWNASVGDVFLKLADSLTVYTIYINNEVIQSPTVGACGKRKAFLNELFNEIPRFTDKALLVNHLRSLLIAPIQRLCKYPLLIRELVAATDESHRDTKTLRESLEKLQEAAVLVNEEKKVAEQQLKLQECEESIIDTKNFEIRTPGRVLVMEGPLLKISKGKTQERQFYLFNDVIVYGRASLIKTGRVHMKGKISLAHLVVNDVEDTVSVKNCFEIVRLDHKKKKYIICSKFTGSKGEANKEMWKKAIKQQTLIQRLIYEDNPIEDEEAWEPVGIGGNDILKKTLTLTRSPFRTKAFATKNTET